MTRTILSAVAATGIGAAAVIGGATLEPATPTQVLASEDTAQEDAIARVVADMTRDEDPAGWDARFGDGTHD